ncbi:hypothetical protein KEM60_00414 [Austwickia sp. TVS 96-490-7B]|uniref:LiaF domain-containing protein n=1 Tax=Austwickia sp. TVS 96-490-7B TaxID=2830843 RepID=UPI001C5A0354|nr:LiaF domain-containing protein [Austwickia sp. TVS 96-490-7B]MBW3084228.1 hypothetical protein [Austwickia sp. TVS 96-490-7B]
MRPPQDRSGRHRPEEVSARFEIPVIGEDGSLTTPPPVTPQGSQGQRAALAFFGEVTRQGPWTIASKLRVGALFGEVTLDLRDVTFTAHLTRIVGVSLFASVKVLVPPTVELRVTGLAVFGEHQVTGSLSAAPGAPIVCVDVVPVFGETTVTQIEGSSA